MGRVNTEPRTREADLAPAGALLYAVPAMTRPGSSRVSKAPTRRQFMGMSAAAIAAAAGDRLAARKRAPTARREESGRNTPLGPRFAYVGSFTSETRHARGEGLSAYRIDQASGRWARVQLLSREVNPAYLAVDPKRPVLYAVHSEANQVSALSINEMTGELTLLNRQSCGGDNPVHLELDATGKHLVVANYGSGTVVVLPVNADGSLRGKTDLVALKGELGPHRTEQSVPHPHHCPFDPTGRIVVVPDKGLDRLFVFKLDPVRGVLVPADPPSVKTRSGAGPRHIGFNPRLPFAYVINELDSTIVTYRFDGSGVLEPLQVLPSIPASFTGDNTGAAVDVAPSGRFVYVSNRGHDSVGIFRVDEPTGLLSPVTWEPTKGATPRFIGLDPAGARLYAANQNGDTIVEFDVDETTGILRATGRIVVTGTPVCAVWR
jgi:6-phosphogluconolactonase (cycloisomerase 2 family)